MPDRRGYRPQQCRGQLLDHPERRLEIQVERACRVPRTSGEAVQRLTQVAPALFTRMCRSPVSFTTSAAKALAFVLSGLGRQDGADQLRPMVADGFITSRLCETDHDVGQPRLAAVRGAIIVPIPRVPPVTRAFLPG